MISSIPMICRSTQLFVDKSGVDYKDSLQRMGYIQLRGHVPVSQKLMECGKSFLP